MSDHRARRSARPSTVRQRAQESKNGAGGGGGRGGRRLLPSEEEKQVRAEAERLELLEVTAKQVFRTGGASGRGLNLAKLRRFLQEHGGQAAVDAMEGARLQVQKLAVVWTFGFDPPLQCAELVQWNESNGVRRNPEGRREGGRKNWRDLSGAELKNRLEEVGAPEEVVANVGVFELDGMGFCDLEDPMDLEAVAGGDGAGARWLRLKLGEIGEERRERKRGQVEEEKGAKEKRVVELMREGKWQEAGELLVGERQGTANLEGDEVVMQRLALQERLGRELGQARELERSRRVHMLSDRLGVAGQAKDQVHFLSGVEVDAADALAQIKKALEPVALSGQVDAAWQVRQKLAGMAKLKPHVKLNVPEGLEASLAQLAWVEKSVAVAGKNNIGFSEAFTHLRNVLRANSNRLQALEMGFVCLGGLRMILSSVEAYNRDFQPGKYGEGIPDWIVNKVRMCANDREKYINMHARILELKEREKRPIVVASSNGKSKGVKRKHGDWPYYTGTVTLNVHRDDGPKPRYAIVKAIRGKQHELIQQGEYKGKLCSKCALYHGEAEVCPLFMFPKHRPKSFRDIYSAGKNAGVIREDEISEWNGRPGRSGQHRCGPDGKCLADETLKHLRVGVPGGPQ